MNDKSRMFSIGDLAKSIGITRKIILNYESKGLIKPDAKDGFNGNRYYTIDTFTQIRTIRVLQNLGLSLDEIRDYFDDVTDLNPLIHRLETLRDEITINIEKLYERTNSARNKISRIKVDPQVVYCKNIRTKSIAERSIILRDTACEAMKKYGTDTTRRMYFTEYSLSDSDEILFAVAVNPKSAGKNVLTLPGFDAISIYHHGAYEELANSREKLLTYAKENNLKISGRCRHVYVEGPPQHKDSSRFVTQIILPVN